MKKVIAAVFIMVLIPVGYSFAEMKQSLIKDIIVHFGLRFSAGNNGGPAVKKNRFIEDAYHALNYCAGVEIWIIRFSR